MAYLQPAAWIILPWAEEGVDGLLEACVKQVQSLHGDSVIETQTAIVVVQVHTNTRRVPVVSDGDAPVLPIGIQTVLQAYAPVALGRSQADKALPVAALGGDPQVPYTFVLHIHLPVVLSAGVLSRGQDAAEPGEASWQVWLLTANASLLHFGVKV